VTHPGQVRTDETVSALVVLPGSAGTTAAGVPARTALGAAFAVRPVRAPAPAG
jgi:hypothetical protein